MTTAVGAIRTAPVRGRVVLRVPGIADGAALWELARSAGGLDVNSPYAYLVLCRSFAETCVLAEDAVRSPYPIGFLSAFRPPSDPDVVFVWQVAVAPPWRRRGVAGAMLRELLARPACGGVRYVEATATLGNRASRAMFLRLAADVGTGCAVGPGFPRGLFPGGGHEQEHLLRVGPLD